MVLTESGNNVSSKPVDLDLVEDDKENMMKLSPIGKIIEIPSPANEDEHENPLKDKKRETSEEKGKKDVKEDSSVRTVNMSSAKFEQEEKKEENEVIEPMPAISELVSVGLWSEEAEVVKESLRFLIKVTYQNEKEKENRNAVIWMGGHLAVLKVVEKFNDVEITARGLRLLQILATLPDLRSVIAAIGGIEFVIAQMKASTDLNLKTYGCGALQNIVADSSPNKMRLMASGGMLQICLAMKAYPHSEELQRFGCGAILNLASTSGQTLKDKVVEEDGLVVLAMTMGNHRYKPAIRNQAIEAFKQLL